MICTNCGHQNTTGATACEQCGAALPTQPPVPPMSAPPPNPPPQASTPQYNAPPAGTRAPIPNHLVWAILTTIFCCLPTGIVAIVFAAQVDGKAAAGDYDGAQKASDNAKLWSWISLAIGLVGVVGWFGLMGLGIMADAGGY